MKYKYLFLLSVISFFNIQALTAQNWTQVSNTLYGSTSGDCFGRAVSISRDGTILAVSSPQNDINGQNSGKVSVYKLDNNQWIQLGNDLNGGSDYNYYGSSIKLSNDGLNLIIGSSTDHDPSGNWFGSISVFNWNGNNWIQKGNKIYGQSYGGYFGHSVGINQDGSIILVSSYNENKVRAFEWNENLLLWEQKGNTIPQGGNIDFSSDGTTFIIGSPFENNGIGKVGVYYWSGGNWIQKGAVFNGINNDQLGRNVSLNSNGNVILIGAPNNDNNGNNTGEIKIYQWNGISWDQKGQTFNGIIPTNTDCCLSNFASSIDSSGNTFAYWSVLSDNPQQGVLKIFSWNTYQWSQKGANIEGGLGDNTMVNFISLSSEGNTISIGFPYDFYFGDGNDSGRVKTYNWSENLSSDNSYLNYVFNFYPNPVKEFLHFKTEHNILKIEIYDIAGRILSSNSVSKNKIDLSVLKSGNYILNIYTEKGIMKTKIVKE